MAARQPVGIADSGERAVAQLVQLSGSGANPRTAFNGAFRAGCPSRSSEPGGACGAFDAQYEIERTAAQLVACSARAV